MRLTQKGFTVLHVLLLIVIIGIVAGTGWYVYDSQKSFDQSVDVSTGISTLKAERLENDKTAEATRKAAPEKRISDDWLLRDSSEASIRVPDGFNILAAKDEPVSFYLPNDQGELMYQKGAKAQVVGEIHKHFGLGLLAGFNSAGLNDLGEHQRSLRTYSDLDVEVKLYVQQETGDVPAFPIGSKYLKYKVSKGSKIFTVDYIYEGEGIVDIIDEMVKTIVIK